MPGTAQQKLRGLDGFFYFATGNPVSTTGSTTISSPNVTVTSGAGIANGMTVTGAGIPANTTVVSGGGTTALVLSANATATASGVALTFTPTVAKIAHCSGWELNVKADSVDASDHDSQGWKDKLAGLKEFTGTIDTIYFTNDSTQLSVIDAVLTGNVTIAGEFRPLDQTGEVKFTGNLVITDFKAAAKGSTAQAMNLSFEGRGPLTRAAI